MIDKFAVMGNPVAHSLSPLIHQHFAKQTGKVLNYEKILVKEQDFEKEVASFFARGGRGLNITLPFKERAFLLAATATARCQQAKAANTLWLSEGKLQADNTDGIGLINDLAHHLKLKGKQVLILGAGGAARGIINPLLLAKTKLTLSSRSKEKAQAFLIDFNGLGYCPLSELNKSYDLIINATSTSLSGQSLDLPACLIGPNTLCYDLAYKLREKTSFTLWAESLGAKGLDGLGMLIEQAAEAFYCWYGLRPDTSTLLAELRHKPSIFSSEEYRQG